MPSIVAQVRTLIADLPLVTVPVYGVRLPNDIALPVILVTKISVTRGLTHSGSTGIAEARIQVDIYGETMATTQTLADAVRAFLHGYVGGSIAQVSMELEQDFVDEPDDSFRVSLDFIVNFYEE